MEFLKHLLGNNGFWFHFAGTIFSIIGCISVKRHYWLLYKKVNNASFDFNFWVKNNWFDIMWSVVLSFVFVRFIDVLLQWINAEFLNELTWKIPVTEDQIFYYLFAGVLVQWWMHKKYGKNITNKHI